MSLPDPYSIDLDLRPIILLIEQWIYRFYYFLKNTHIVITSSFRFSLWDFTIGAMIISAVTAALLPDSFVGFDNSVVGEFYDDGYFDDDRYQL